MINTTINTLKTLTLLALLFNTGNSLAQELQSFDAIKTAAITGKPIHIVIDFSKCASPRRPELTSIGVFTPNALHVTQEAIMTSLKHFTLNHPRFPDKPVYEFIRYTLTHNNQVVVTTQVLEAIHYVPVSDQLSFQCEIGAGATFYD
jgi:hypothetical protein